MATEPNVPTKVSPAQRSILASADGQCEMLKRNVELVIDDIC